MDDPRLGRVRYRLLSRGQLRSIDKELAEADFDKYVERAGLARASLNRREARSSLQTTKVLNLALVEPRASDIEVSVDTLGALTALGLDVLNRSRARAGC